MTQEAPWKHSDLPMTVVFNDRMWLMGGWYNGRLPGHSASNEVWSSSDGLTWEQATDHAGWSPRLAAGAVAFKGRLWVLGGTEDYYFGDDKSLKNDVWSSADGKEWKREVANAPWSPRAYHAAVVHDGKIWVLGGGNYVPRYHALNDVWCSSDGTHWEQVTEHAPWAPRIWFSAVVYRDRMWVLGGWSNNPSKNWGDVWYSQDGKDWTKLAVECRLEGAPRALHLRLPGQDLGGGRTRPAAQQRSLVPGGPARLVRGRVEQEFDHASGRRSVAGEQAMRQLGTSRRSALTAEAHDAGVEVSGSAVSVTPGRNASARATKNLPCTTQACAARAVERYTKEG